jgi:hypothetical protein
MSLSAGMERGRGRREGRREGREVRGRASAKERRVGAWPGMFYLFMRGTCELKKTRMKGDEEGNVTCMIEVTVGV